MLFPLQSLIMLKRDTKASLFHINISVKMKPLYHLSCLTCSTSCQPSVLPHSESSDCQSPNHCWHLVKDHIHCHAEEGGTHTHLEGKHRPQHPQSSLCCLRFPLFMLCFWFAEWFTEAPYHPHRVWGQSAHQHPPALPRNIYRWVCQVLLIRGRCLSDGMKNTHNCITARSNPTCSFLTKLRIFDCFRPLRRRSWCMSAVAVRTSTSM